MGSRKSRWHSEMVRPSSCTNFLELLHPKKVIVPAPSFSEYRLSAEAAGCPVDSFLLKADQGFALPLEEIEKKLLPHSLIDLGHPNNPDGQLLSPSDFEAVLHLAKKKRASSSLMNPSLILWGMMYPIGTFL